jgi:hypothetical protein
MVPRYRIGAGEGRAQVFLPDRPRRIHFQRRLSTSVSTQRTTTGVPCSSTRAAWGWSLITVVDPTRQGLSLP